MSMSGETDLQALLKNMKPELQEGDYVFCTVPADMQINQQNVLGFFKEEEGNTVIVSKAVADKLQLNYSFVAAWIILKVHSSLEAVGLTAAFSNALAKEGVSCNVFAACYHDHIFVAKDDAEKAINTLLNLSVGL